MYIWNDRNKQDQAYLDGEWNGRDIQNFGENESQYFIAGYESSKLEVSQFELFGIDRFSLQD